MPTIFKIGDKVRLTMLPSNYGGTIKELTELIGLELVVVRLENEGERYVLTLDKPREIGGQSFKEIPVYHTWVEAIVTTEAL